MEPRFWEEQERVIGWDLTMGISHWRVCPHQLLLGHPGPEMGTAMFHHLHHCTVLTVPPSPSQTPLPNTGPAPKWANTSHRQPLSLQHSPGTGCTISPSWSGNTGAIVVLVLLIS